MKTRLALAISVASAAMAFATSAYAVPVTNVNGIGVPVGTAIINETEFEDFATPVVGSPFQGFGAVTSISYGTLATTYTPASTGIYLYSEFSGFQFSSLVGQDAYFTGGEYNYYQFSSDQSSVLDSMTSISGIISYLKTNGTLFLSLTPKDLDGLGHTLDITVPHGLGDADQSGAKAYLDVVTGTGTNVGLANSLFNTCTYSLPTAPAGSCSLGLTDLAYSGHAQDNVQGAAFPIVGGGTLTGFTVPEPVTISLFGAGLIGAAFGRRRKAKQKA